MGRWVDRVNAGYYDRPDLLAMAQNRLRQIREEREDMEDRSLPTVKFFKDRSPHGNGSFSTSTTASDSDAFLRGVAQVLPHILEVTLGDQEFTLDKVLPQICEIWAKLKGYRAESVYEQRVLTAGHPNPEGHWDYLNDEEPLTASDLLSGTSTEST